MSRCFPFPPPGYERKLIVDNDNLLAKEKHKDKKEKKHKRDKEKDKKEGTEKDRERSKERHREKDKEKKEKHKHKDRDKKNEKKRSRDGTIEERFNVEKVGSSSSQSSQVSGTSCVELEELVHQICHKYDAAGNQNVHEVNDGTLGKAELLDRLAGSTWDKNGHNGAHVDPSQEALIVQELERRTRDENNATGNHFSSIKKSDVHKRAQSNGIVANGNGSYPIQVKEIAKLGTGNFSLENGRKDLNQSKALKVAIVHNIKTLEHVNTSKKAVLEGTLRNGFSGNGGVDNKGTKIQTKDGYRNKPLKGDSVKQGSECIVKLSRLGGNGSDSADNAKLRALKEGYEPGEEITGKRKEPEGILHGEVRNRASEGVTGKHQDFEGNGILHENEKQPDKRQRTVLSSKPVTENGRNLQSGGTFTLSACNQGVANGLNSEKHKPNGSIRAHSPLASKVFPSSTAKATGIIRTQSPHCSTMLPAPGKANNPLIPLNGTIQAQSPHHSTTLPPSGKPIGPLIPVKENSTVQESSHSSTQPNLTIHGTLGSSHAPLSSTKPSSTKAEANGTLGAHPMMPKSSASSAKDKKHKKISSPKRRSPHPDSKYLSQILSVPKMEEWSELDDPEWLFGSQSFSSKEAEEGCGRDGELQVWAKAVRIDSADVCALPYVIPH